MYTPRIYHRVHTQVGTHHVHTRVHTRHTRHVRVLVHLPGVTYCTFDNGVEQCSAPHDGCVPGFQLTERRLRRLFCPECQRIP